MKITHTEPKGAPGFPWFVEDEKKLTAPTYTQKNQVLLNSNRGKSSSKERQRMKWQVVNFGLLSHFPDTTGGGFSKGVRPPPYSGLQTTDYL